MKHSPFSAELHQSETVRANKISINLLRKIIVLNLEIIFFFFINNISFGQLATWSGPWSGTAPSPMNATTVSANVSSATLSRYILGGASSTTRYSSRDWNNSNYYLAISITANAGYVLNMNGQTVSIAMGSTSTGPSGYYLFSSVDNFTTSLGILNANSPCGIQQDNTITLPATGYNDLSSITFRIVGIQTGCSSSLAGTGTGGPSSITINGTTALQTNFFVNDNSKTGDVFTTAIGNNTNPGTADAPFATIQHAISVANAGNIIYADAGTYAENVVVSKEVTINGAGRGNTIVIPALSSPNSCGGSSLCPTASNVFLVQANNVTIQNLTVDGDNPSLTSGVNVGGADIDARNGIITNHSLGVYNNLTVANVTIKNIFLRGMYASSGGTFNFHDNIVTNVQADPSSIGMFNFGGSGSFTNNTVSFANDAISSNWSTGTIYSGNTITNSGSGIHTDNNGGSGGVADEIFSNNVSNSSNGGYGIWVFAPYTNVSVHNNKVTNVDVGMALAGQQAAVTPEFYNNEIDGQNKLNSTGMYVTTSLFGFGSTNVSVNFNNNIVKNNAGDGFYLESENGYSLTLNAHKNSITGNSPHAVEETGAGTFAADMSCNWWGTTIPSDIASSISGTVNHIPFLTNGTDADPATAGFQTNEVCGSCNINPIIINNTGTTELTCTIKTITVTATGGSNYSWNGGTNPTSAENNFNTPGIYTVTISDPNGCSNSTSIEITQDISVPSVSLSSQTNVSCNGKNDGTININPSGGITPYTYSWTKTDDLGFSSTSANLSNLSAGTYNLIVTGTNGCSSETLSVIITQPDLFNASIISQTNVDCYSNNTGSVTASVSGGVAPYSYSLDGEDFSNTSGTFNSLIAGNYLIRVKDNNSCTSTIPVSIIQSDLLTASIASQSDVSCFGESNGAITVSANGGAGTYQYKLNDGAFQDNNTFTGLIIGDYSVTVKDANGCTSSVNATIKYADNAAPVITNCLGTLARNADLDVCTYTVKGNEFDVAASDNCPLTYSYELSGALISNGNNSLDGVVFSKGTTHVKWTVSDGLQSSVCEFDAVVNDNQPPVITAIPDDVTVSCTNDVPSADNTAVSAKDNCDGTITITNKDVMTPGNCPSRFIIKRTYTATDESGNSSSQVQTITVDDETAPLITNCPLANFTRSTSAEVCSYTVIENEFDINATDNCGTPALTYLLGGATTGNGNTSLAGIVFNRGVTTITWTATDVCNNSSACSFTVTVTDNENPVITCPSNVIVNTDAEQCYATINSVNIGTAIATDNCYVSSLFGTRSDGQPLNAVYPIGITTITWIAVDKKGNYSACYQTITVNGSVPVITCPGDILVNNDFGKCFATISVGTATVSTNCGVTSIIGRRTDNLSLTDPYPVGLTHIIWTATYGVNNNLTTSCTQTVIVNDNEKPSIVCPSNITVNNDAGKCYASNVSLGSPSTSDNCGVASITNNAPAQFPVGNTTITWTVTDVHGNTNTCTQIVSVTDNETPSIACPSDITQASSNGINASISVPDPVYNDNCGSAKVTWAMTGATSGNSNSSGINKVGTQTFNVGLTTITYTATDISGNVSGCSFTVTVTFAAPSITCPANITQNITSGCSKSISVPNPLINNLTTLTWILTGATTGSSPTSGINYVGTKTFDVGVTTITYTGKNAGGTVTCSFTVTVLENVAPVITKCAAPQSANVNGNCQATVPNFIPFIYATDNCTPSNKLIITQSPVAGTIVSTGITNVTITVKDASGNSNSCNTTFTAKDNIAPVITQCAPPQVGYTNSNCQAAVPDFTANVSASDNCTPVNQLVITQSPAVGKMVSVGITNVTITVKDASGNSKTCSTSFTVKDNIPPVITCPGNITANAGNNCSTSITVSNPKASDNCGVKSLTWTMTGATTGNSSSGGINYIGKKNFNAGITTVTYTAKDAANNSSSCSFTVTISTTNKNCNSSQLAISSSGVDVKLSRMVENNLVVNTFPNPTQNYFNLKITSARREEVWIKVFDISGRLVHQTNGSVDKIYRFGDMFAAGVYVVEVQQGSQRVIAKVIKQ